ncbi:Teneurin-3 [Anas platyrhynchos]|uniref:Teneurin-3 n=1 Tax=Anas platyrhynchos TaxID=8839 RepID=R0K9V4_ANAPL|nr:Teneurin-3 [Anas platyrhynchos]
MAQAVGVSYGRCFGISLRTRSSLCEAAQLPNCRRLAFYAPWPSFAGMPQVHCAPVVLETGCNYKAALPAAQRSPGLLPIDWGEEEEEEEEAVTIMNWSCPSETAQELGEKSTAIIAVVQLSQLRFRTLESQRRNNFCIDEFSICKDEGGKGEERRKQDKNEVAWLKSFGVWPSFLKLPLLGHVAGQSSLQPARCSRKAFVHQDNQGQALSQKCMASPLRSTQSVAFADLDGMQDKNRLFHKAARRGNMHLCPQIGILCSPDGALSAEALEASLVQCRRHTGLLPGLVRRWRVLVAWKNGEHKAYGAQSPLTCWLPVLLGPPMPSSSSSPSVTEHLHSPPPSPNLHDNQRWLLSNNASQPVQDSDTDEDYTASSYLVQTGTLSVSVPGHENCNLSCVTKQPFPLAEPFYVLQNDKMRFPILSEN